MFPFITFLGSFSFCLEKLLGIENYNVFKVPTRYIILPTKLFNLPFAPLLLFIKVIKYIKKNILESQYILCFTQNLKNVRFRIDLI